MSKLLDYYTVLLNLFIYQFYHYYSVCLQGFMEVQFGIIDVILYE